jgi:hypothetical protein
MKTLLKMIPLPSHSPTRAPILEGRDQMKAVSAFAPLAISHTESTATTTTS